MKTYKVVVYANKWPSEYIVVGSNWATAIARAIREWKGRFKGSRAATIKVVATKGGELLTEEK